jgi:hypothetical protein
MRQVRANHALLWSALHALRLFLALQRGHNGVEFLMLEAKDTEDFFSPGSESAVFGARLASVTNSFD